MTETVHHTDGLPDCPIDKTAENRTPTRWAPDAEFRFWIYDPNGDGMVYYRSAEERDADFERIIDANLDDTWSEEMEQGSVCAGEVTHIAVQTRREDRPPEPEDEGSEEWEDWAAEWDNPDVMYRCWFEFKPIGAPPATATGEGDDAS